VQDGPADEPLPDIDWRPYRRWRDWRVYAGGLGRVLLVTGLLVLAFVAYQLWGTGIQAAQSQDELEEEFEAALSATSTSAPTTTPPPTTTTDPGTAGSAPSTSASPSTAPTTTSAPATPAVHEGDPIARLEIPRIGHDWIVVAGVRVEDLRKGPGHYPDTPLPGQEGNVAIAGHRTTYGAPFERINELEPGDEIILTTFTGRFVYRMAGQRIVPPTDGSVLDPTPTPVVTLTSCHPKYSARERIVVQALFDADASDALAPAAPGYAPAAGSEPAAATTAPPTTAAPATAEGSAAPADTTAAPAAVVVTTSPAPSRSPSADALEHGWFDDQDAWPQVALWGGVLLLISFAAWRLGKRTGRDWVGALAGVVPFVVALYFFFENVNRLLPPNL
jgi:sortase A